MLFKTDAEKAFGVETYLSPEMENAIKLWEQLESGKPPWVDDDIRTIRFSNTISEEMAKLVTQNIDIKIQGTRSGVMPGQMQKVMDKCFLDNAKEIIYSMVDFGGVMAKWDGKGVEFLRPGMFLPTEVDNNKEILAAIFLSYWRKEKKIYTKMEWHRFENVTSKGEDGESSTVRTYHISTKAFRSDNENEIGTPVPLSATKWKDIEPEAWIDGLEKPLFRYIKCPVSNGIDPNSPIGVPCFSNCTEELRWLDIAMSTMGTETENSAPVLFVDVNMVKYANEHSLKLPKFVHKLDLGGRAGEQIEDWQPTLQVASRKEGINFYLSVIGFKCGYDPGYFVFDGQSIQMATATQVESTERRTINTVLSYRSVLDRPNSNGDGRVGAIHDIAYIINAGLIINGKAEDGTIIPFVENGNYELFCDFADLTENKEEEKLFDYQLAQNGYMSKARFLIRHLGLTEEEAIAMVAEAQAEQQPEGGALFGEE